MEKVEIKKKPTTKELMFLTKICAQKPIPWSLMSEEVILYFNQAKLNKLVEKFGNEFNYIP
jgi:hypothetical protein